MRDQVAYQGPVSGIYHGLKAATKEVCFVTSCDAPFLNLALISHLLSQISDCDVVVPFWQERFQPLHAVYRRSVAPLLHEQLERGELRPIFLYDKVRTRKIHEDEIRRFDPEGLSFLNMNSPEDYDAALQAVGSKNSTPHLRFRRAFRRGPHVGEDPSSVSRRCRKKRLSRMSFQPSLTNCRFCVGRVINSEGLITGYTCNINGLDFVRAPSAKINSGDKIFILSADAGG